MDLDAVRQLLIRPEHFVNWSICIRYVETKSHCGVHKQEQDEPEPPPILRLLRGSIIGEGRSARSTFRLFRPVTKLVIEGFSGQSQDIV